MDIAGKAFIVTGGASGLGEGSARMLAREGGKVVIADLQVDKGQALAAELGGVFVRCDVSQEADGRAVVAAAQGLDGVAADAPLSPPQRALLPALVRSPAGLTALATSAAPPRPSSRRTISTPSVAGLSAPS
mgnify:CR=1 FL=1